MEEVFAEYIIKSRITGKSILLRFAAILGLFLGLCSFFVLGVLGITVTALMIYVLWYVFTLTNIEYEYSIVNTDIMIDKIMGQRKRKRVAEYDLKKAEVVAYANSEHMAYYKGKANVEDYSSRTGSDSVVAVVFPEGAEITELLFEPNERIIEAMRRVRPGIMRLD